MKNMITPFQNTTVYKKTLSTINEIVGYFSDKEKSIINDKLEEEAMNAITYVAKGLSKYSEQETIQDMNKAVECTFSIMALIDVARENNIINGDQKDEFQKKLSGLQNDINNFEKNRKRIIILSAEVGQGHMTASKAIQEAIEHKYGYDYKVEIADFVDLLNSMMNVVTKRNYDNLVKFAPSIYKLIYESTNKQVQIVKLLNQLNYPFVLTRVKKYFQEKQPDILISTFPVWNYVAAEIWKKHKKDAKFISVVTDSISIHNSWVLADTDYHIVANKDTAEALHNMGVEQDKIKILGFPIRLTFLQKTNKESLLSEIGLDSKKFTILYLPTAQNHRKNQKIITDLSTLNGSVNIIIITGRDKKLKPKLEKMNLPANIKLIGWTDKMSDYIKVSDLVITKAGGATIMECIAAAKPMIITSIIPGQEQGNAELIKKYHLGIVALNSKPDILENIKYIRQKYSFFKKNIEKQSNPEAALKIAEFIHQII
jgi:processive 1,2-diacylglycerol beta-glucosyltransferase